jgi:hypothetical protein
MKKSVSEVALMAFMFIPTVLIIAILLRGFISEKSISVSAFEKEFLSLCGGGTQSVSISDVNYRPNIGLFQLVTPDDIELSYDLTVLKVYDAWNNNNYAKLLDSTNDDVQKRTRKGNLIISECTGDMCFCIGNSLTTFMSLKDMSTRACFTKIHNVGREFFDDCVLSFEKYCTNLGSSCDTNIFGSFLRGLGITSYEPNNYTFYSANISLGFNIGICNNRCESIFPYTSQLIQHCTSETIRYLDEKYEPTSIVLEQERLAAIDCYETFGPGGEFLFTYTGQQGGWFLGITNPDQTLNQEEPRIIFEAMEDFAEKTGYGFVLEFSSCFKLPRQDDCFCPSDRGREINLYAPDVGKKVMIGIAGSHSESSEINIAALTATLTDVDDTCDFSISAVQS